MHETRAIVIPLPPVRVSCVCSSAHVTRAVPIVFKLSRGKAFFRPVFGTATPSRGPSETSPRGEEGFYRHFGTAPPPTTISVASPRGEGVIYRVFGTATLPTSISVASSRGKGVIYRVFGKATPSTDASVASSRSHCELVYRIVAELGFVKFTWHEPLLIIK